MSDKDQYCQCLMPIVQLIPIEQCLDCKKPLKPKKIRKKEIREALVRYNNTFPKNIKIIKQ